MACNSKYLKYNSRYPCQLAKGLNETKHNSNDGHFWAYCSVQLQTLFPLQSCRRPCCFLFLSPTMAAIHHQLPATSYDAELTVLVGRTIDHRALTSMPNTEIKVARVLFSGPEHIEYAVHKWTGENDMRYRHQRRTRTV